MAVLMTKEFWQNSQLSIARRYGRVSFNGTEFIVVNKEGKDIFQCSAEAKKAGRAMAIEEDEPADLVRRDFVKYYRALGRDKFIEILMQNRYASDKELIRIYKYEINKIGGK